MERGGTGGSSSGATGGAGGNGGGVLTSGGAANATYAGVRAETLLHREVSLVLQHKEVLGVPLILLVLQDLPVEPLQQLQRVQRLAVTSIHPGEVVLIHELIRLLTS